MKSVFLIFNIILSGFIISSTSASAQNVLDQDDVYLVDSLGSNKIYFHKNIKLIDMSYHSNIIENIKIGIDTTSLKIAFENVDFRVMVFPERTVPRLGMSGVAPNSHQIYILLDPDHPKLDEAINKHIVEVIPHEYHHTMRNRNLGQGKNLLDALINEGLACHFAIEVCRMDTSKYLKAYSRSQLEDWKKKAKKEWYNSDYDYFDWFVGRTKPRNIGYAIGFDIVANYLDKHPDETAATLKSTPSEVFINYW